MRLASKGEVVHGLKVGLGLVDHLIDRVILRNEASEMGIALPQRVDLLRKIGEVGGELVGGVAHGLFSLVLVQTGRRSAARPSPTPHLRQRF